MLGTITFPLAFRLYKPKSRLKAIQIRIRTEQSQLSVALIQDLRACGFRFSVELADSLSGESSELIVALHRPCLHNVVALRSNHDVRTSPDISRPTLSAYVLSNCVSVRAGIHGREQGAWCREQRCIRAVVFGQWRPPRSFELTTNPAHLSCHALVDPEQEAEFKSLRSLMRQVATAFPQARTELRVVDVHRAQATAPPGPGSNRAAACRPDAPPHCQALRRLLRPSRPESKALSPDHLGQHPAL